MKRIVPSCARSGPLMTLPIREEFLNTDANRWEKTIILIGQS